MLQKTRENPLGHLEIKDGTAIGTLTLVVHSPPPPSPSIQLPANSTYLINDWTVSSHFYGQTDSFDVLGNVINIKTFWGKV